VSAPTTLILRATSHIFRSGASAKLQYFLVASTCLLYLVAAGLFSKAVWFFEAQQWNNIVGGDAAEAGSGPGSYDITKSVWHVNVRMKHITSRHLTNTQKFANPEINGGGGWGVFNSILGWQNSATYGTVISYNVYWIAVVAGFFAMRYREVKGHWPLTKTKRANKADEEQPNSNVRASSEGSDGGISADKGRGDVLERPLSMQEIPA
jgi:high-affinity iron transporter